MAVKCSCNGGNPNCYKCDGWGWVEDGVREAPEKESSAPPPFERFAANNGRNKKPVPKKSRKLTKNGQLLCPSCKKVIRGERLFSYLDESCIQGESNQSNTLEYVRLAFGDPKIIIRAFHGFTCPNCTHALSESFLAGHFIWEVKKVAFSPNGLRKYVKTSLKGKGNNSINPCPICDRKIKGKDLLFRHLTMCLEGIRRSYLL